jgi:AraC family transcriptional regulator
MIQCYQLDDMTSVRLPELTGNRVTFSGLTHCEMEKYTVDTYSIKYVLRGTEHYFIGNKKFSVSGGNFLLVNAGQPLNIAINSRQKVLGFCIHIEKHIVEDVYTDLLLTEEKRLADPSHQLQIPEFEELIYKEVENNLGIYLRQIVGNYDSNTGRIAVESTAFYHQLCRHLLLTQNTYLRGNSNLSAVKNSTKRELLRRLELAKEIMETTDIGSLQMEVIAQQAMLSGSHFFRSFKKQYGVSPYQYALQKKLERSAQILFSETTSITDIALDNGFADVASFSKAFKRQFGVSPVRFVYNSSKKK